MLLTERKQSRAAIAALQSSFSDFRQQIIDAHQNHADALRFVTSTLAARNSQESGTCVQDTHATVYAAGVFVPDGVGGLKEVVSLSQFWLKTQRRN